MLALNICVCLLTELADCRSLNGSGTMIGRAVVSCILGCIDVINIMQKLVDR